MTLTGCAMEAGARANGDEIEKPPPSSSRIQDPSPSLQQQAGQTQRGRLRSLKRTRRWMKFHARKGEKNEREEGTEGGRDDGYI